MSFRDITMLALLLVIGLIFNRCAFHGDAINLTHSERVAQRTIKQAERAAEQVTRQAEQAAKDLERSAQRLNERMDEFSERMGEFGERMGEFGEEIGEKMERVGEHIGEEFEDAGEVPAEDAATELNIDVAAETKTAKVTLSVTHGLGVAPNIDLALDVPVLCRQTSLAFGRERKRTLSITTIGGDGLQSPEIAPVDSETVALKFRGETPRELSLELPRNVPYVRFALPQAVKLALSEDMLLIKLDAPAVGSLKVTRSKKLLTVRHADWTLNISGISQPLRFMGLDGTMFGGVGADQKGEVGFGFTSRENEGGRK